MGLIGHSERQWLCSPIRYVGQTWSPGVFNQVEKPAVPPFLWKLANMEPVSPEEREALLQGPAATPPPGLESNLTDPPNQRVASYFMIIFFGFLATFALVIRVYTRAFILRRFKIADCKLTACNLAGVSLTASDSLILGWVLTLSPLSLQQD